MKLLPLGWAGIWRRRARTILTGLCIAVAFLLLGLLDGVNAARKRAVTNLLQELPFCKAGCIAAGDDDVIQNPNVNQT
jgi:hypothetical protein